MSSQTNPLYWKRVKDQLEAYNTKVSSIALRKKILDDQTRINYSNEMSNIRELYRATGYYLKQ